ncbi:astacin-like metalloprotease toxin 5 [Neocloeon triangulifer]|uniref:astacin-like metalloprotease toxin 5 n=1 Tax=Neocloeon triangulifer TaxID=2078957 RepID=UPI00286EBA16|nr:astacin-like metalloprotease toxin 5 [Neocloeon triangulifer]
MLRLLIFTALSILVKLNIALYQSPVSEPVVFPHGYNKEQVERNMKRWRPEHGHQLWTLSGLREGDIMDNHHAGRNVIRDTKKLWKNNTVPFAFTPGYSQEEILEVIKGMNIIMNGSCIKFRSYEPEIDDDYILIRNDLSGCWSLVGRQGTGQQPVSLMTPRNGYTCIQYGLAAHEFLHALGFEHEHNAANRDDYVTIHFENVKPENYHDFDKVSEANFTDFCVGYDYDSVMHYGRTTFSINETYLETIVPKDPNAVIGQSDHVSKKDFQKLNLRYNCTDFL